MRVYHDQDSFEREENIDLDIDYSKLFRAFRKDKVVKICALIWAVFIVSALYFIIF